MRRTPNSHNTVWALTWIFSWVMTGPIVAQFEIVTSPDGQAITIDASQAARIQEAQAAAENARAQSGKPQPSNRGKPGQPNADEKPGEKPGEKPDGKPGADGKPAALENHKRSSTPPEPPDPKELDVTPDEEGLLRFQFRNQPWPEVVRWLAKVSNLSLDWQELPGDYINLATQRPFTIEEATDMINRALLTRGFTLLKQEGVLLVTKVENLNPALVPRVEPSQLSDLPPHSFVRTSFTLSWLLAEELTEEFGSMISKNGKLTALTSTNRLEAMDAAANLLDIHEILENEQSLQALENLAREFTLEHARASAVKMQLEEFLGLSSNAGGSSGSSRDAMRMQQQMAQQMQQQMQQMQQQMQQAAQRAGGAKPSASRQRPTETYLVANDRTNSLIVHTSPDKMAIIASFIARIDVPNENAADYQRMNTRMKVFRLASLSPGELVASLTAMDVLEPSTRLQVDETNNAIIAYASIADQYLIQSVVDRLDGSERTFEVIQLRRLEAEAVAGSIKFLMGAEEEDTSSSRRNYGYYDFYGGYSSQSNKQKKSDKMRVGANIQDNQVLLWANPIEMEEVQKLLVKLGEIAPEGGRRSTTRMIDASRQPETYEYLKRLKEQWEMVSPNTIVLPDESEFQNQEDQAVDKPTNQSADEGKAIAPDDSAPAEKPAPPAGAKDDKITAMPPVAKNRLVSSTLLAPSDEQSTTTSPSTTTASPPNNTGQPPRSDSPIPSQPKDTAAVPPAEPVVIMIDEGGNLVIRSNDTEALDRLEEIMMTNRPPRKPYDLFKVKFATASWVTLNLREYFENKEDDNRRFFSFYFDEMQGNKDDEQLGKKQPLKFIYDNDTNSIVVQGADDMDRKTIKELIELWDVPEPEDEEDRDRYTKLVVVKYSRADAIVNVIKEAYRDLLSATDKSVQSGGNDEESKRPEGGGGVQSSGAMSFAFKGKLSLGADTITNTILISAEGKSLMDIIVDMIDQLDQAARPEGNIEVYNLTASVSGKSFEQALRAMLGTPKKQQPANQQAAQEQQQQQTEAEAQPQIRDQPTRSSPNQSRRRR
ncbi:MAG: secretin N-terminal domain-containing protein [Pirellulaceae bacterium]